MNILITGGAGFIGSHIADSYLKLGHKITIIDNLSTGQRKNIPTGVNFIEGDINDPSLGSIFERQKFDIVNHHAAQFNVRESVANPVADAQTNILGSLHLLELCRKFQVNHFIFASTGGAIYGEQDSFPANESHAANPICPYGVAKLSVEKYMYWYAYEFGMNCTVLRYSNAFGPRQNSKGEAGVVAIFCDQMNANINPVINGDGKQTRDFVYVDDIVAMNVNVLSEKGFNVYNVGTGIEVDINRVFNVLNNLSGGQFLESHGPATLGEQERSSIHSGKAKKKFGWEPKMDIDGGLKLTAEYFRKLL